MSKPSDTRPSEQSPVDSPRKAQSSSLAQIFSKRAPTPYPGTHPSSRPSSGFPAADAVVAPLPSPKASKLGDDAT